MDISYEIEKIRERNLRVEADKAWETSWTRRGFISAATYIVAAVWLIIIHDSFPLLKALVPVAGFILSTLSLPFLKRAWITEFLGRPLSPRATNERAKDAPVQANSVTERLGRTVVEGVVTRGSKEGSRLGFPTINVEVKNGRLESGIFAGKVHVSPRAGNLEPQSYFAAIYVPNHKSIVEAHLLDFSGDLYGVHVRIEILDKVRGAINFSSDDEAKRAIAGDLKAVEKILFGGPDF